MDFKIFDDKYSTIRRQKNPNQEAKNLILVFGKILSVFFYLIGYLLSILSILAAILLVI